MTENVRTMISKVVTLLDEVLFRMEMADTISYAERRYYDGLVAMADQTISSVLGIVVNVSAPRDMKHHVFNSATGELIY